MVDNDENPYRSPQAVDEMADGEMADGEVPGGATVRELIVLLAVVFLMPPGLFAAIVLVAQQLTSVLAD